MTLSSFALVLGVFCYLFGFPQVFCDHKKLAWRTKMLKDDSTIRLFGMGSVMIAVLVLRQQWQISSGIEGVIVIVVWLLLMAGLLCAWWPIGVSKFMLSTGKNFSDSGSRIFVGCMMLLFGALFTYFGILLP